MVRIRVPHSLHALAIAFTVCLPAYAQFKEFKTANYSVFYQPGYEKDLEFARNWLERAEAVLKARYGVPFTGYYIDIYLYPEPKPGADTSTANLKCCSGTGFPKTGVISLLAPSAPIWKNFHGLTSLRLPKDENYHAKVLMSEYITVGHYVVQDTRTKGGGWRYYSAPKWFVQGLQEYDGIFHTTDTNRATTGAELLVWAKSHAGDFKCCESDMQVSDVYNGGAAFVTFLAAQFGEDIHNSLLRDASPTFIDALENQTKLAMHELFVKFQEWLAAPKPPAR